MASKKKQGNNFYMGNPSVPAKGAEFEYTEEMAHELLKCKEDVIHFAENYFYILNLDEGRVKIPLYDAQKRILNGIRDNRFYVLLASRQVGKSTIATIYLLWAALFQSDQKILLVANKETTAIEIFSRIKMAYEMLPNWIKAPVVEYGKTAMELENGSKISVSTTTGTAGRGSSCTFLFLDEAAHIESHLLDSFYASVFPIISSSKKAKVFMCSTPNGTGNLFHQIYTESVEGKNNWGNDKILWSDVPGRDEKWADEIRSGLADDQKWHQEFECCFINTGTSGMNEQLYKELLKGTHPPIEELMGGKYKIWELPNPERIYVAGIDVSDGVGGDFSVIKILDVTEPTEIIEVAEYYDNMTPVAEFTNIVFDILCHWGKPITCIERNNQGGQVIDRLAYDYGYDKLVSWGSKMAGRKTNQLIGMISQRNTKYNACSNARYFYSDARAVVFRNEAALEEVFKDFVKINDTWQAASGKHDDRTMALVWALKVLDRDLVEDWFNLIDVDAYGKPSKIAPLDHGISYFDNPTSIYNNEMIERIEESLLNPVAFGSFGFNEELEEIAQLKAEGWSYLGGGEPYMDPSRNVARSQYENMDKWFG